jgi:hypothetical protein
LGDNEKLRLFDLLYDVVGKRKPEGIQLALEIKLQAVYRYLPNAKKRVIPNHQTTAKIIVALEKKAKLSDVIPFLDLAAERMREAHEAYVRWRKKAEPGVSQHFQKLMLQNARQYNVFYQPGVPRAYEWRVMLIEALSRTGFSIASVPDYCEEGIWHVLCVLNYVRRLEPTEEMRKNRIEEGIESLRRFFNEEIANTVAS